MLINSNGHITFRNMTRSEINHLVSGHCKTEACAEHKQATVLRDLKEVFTLNHKGVKGFSLQDRANLKQ